MVPRDPFTVSYPFWNTCLSIPAAADARPVSRSRLWRLPCTTVVFVGKSRVTRPPTSRNPLAPTKPEEPRCALHCARLGCVAGTQRQRHTQNGYFHLPLSRRDLGQA